jgi:DNA-binding NarL/FixJ family response regulator
VVADTPLNLVLVDTNRTSQKGTELLLRSWGHHVIGCAADGPAGYDAIRTRSPDVAVVDLEGRDGIELAERAAAAFGSRIVLSLGQPDRHELDRALGCGAVGFVLNSADPNELRDAVHDAGLGERHVAPAVEGLVRRRLKGSVLSKRERQVLQLLAGGMTGVQASRELTVSPETIRTHVRNAMRRLDARTRVHAVMIAVAQREIHP